jgi:hypothetical protein
MSEDIVDLALEYPRATSYAVAGIGTAAYMGYRKAKNQGTDALKLENNGEIPTEEEMKDEYGYLDGEPEKLEEEEFLEE